MTSGRLMWRSMLFVPAHKEQYVAKAHLRGADAIQLDLEDSVPVDTKAEARRRAPEAAAQIAAAGTDVLVRVNRPWRLTVPDLEAVVSADVQAVALPKVDSAAHVRLVDEVISELEGERDIALGHTKIIAMIETAAGFLQAAEIARSSARVIGLTLGSEDFSLDVGVPPDPDVMHHPKQQVVIAARAAGIAPLGLVGTLAGFDDLAAFREIVRLSRRLGCVGASAIHPAQVPILNEEFSPTEDEVERARALVAAFEAAGQGAVAIDGRMVDAPVVARAQSLLERHDEIVAREAARNR